MTKGSVRQETTLALSPFETFDRARENVGRNDAVEEDFVISIEEGVDILRHDVEVGHRGSTEDRERISREHSFQGFHTVTKVELKGTSARVAVLRTNGDHWDLVAVCSKSIGNVSHCLQKPIEIADIVVTRRIPFFQMEGGNTKLARACVIKTRRSLPLVFGFECCYQFTGDDYGLPQLTVGHHGGGQYRKSVHGYAVVGVS